MIYCLYIFDRHCNVVFYAHWNGKDDKESIGNPSKAIEEQSKLIYGVVFSLRNIVSKLAKPGEPLLSFKTSTYKLHYFETLSCLRFVMLTDPNLEHQHDNLALMYSSVYVEHVSKNPQYNGGWIDSEVFKSQLVRFVKALPSFE